MRQEFPRDSTFVLDCLVKMQEARDRIEFRRRITPWVLLGWMVFVTLALFTLPTTLVLLGLFLHIF